VRLRDAFATGFNLGFSQLAAIGNDCIDIDRAIFEQTWAALDDHDLVLGPSEDGGYYLIAMREPCARLFQRIPWSTARVLETTLARAAAANRRVHLLPRFPDVDTEEDWHRAASRLASPPH
jgi:hypothetical protein